MNCLTRGKVKLGSIRLGGLLLDSHRLMIIQI